MARLGSLKAHIGAEWASATTHCVVQNSTLYVMSSPFPFQGPLEPGDLKGRDDLVTELVKKLTARRVTALLGPRRYGKTSVLRRVGAELSEMGTVWVDLYEASSMADIAARFDRGLADVADDLFARAARRVAATLSLNLGVLRVDLRGPARDRPDPEIAFSALLEVFVKAALRRPTLLVVDEFSFISRVPAAAGALRTALQHHYREIGIVFAGSQPSMMRTLFTSRSEPFYGQAELVDIGPLDLAAWEAIVSDGFAGTGRGAGPLAGLIHHFTDGHPMRSMQAADASWDLTRPRKTATAETWVDALEALRRREDEPLERIFSRFGDSEKAVLRAVAISGSVYGVEAGLLGVAGGTAANARQRLIDSGDLVKTEAGVKVTDPMMADWLRRRFPI